MDAPDTALARFARDHHGHFTTEHANMLGFSDVQRAYRLRVGTWERIHDDVFRFVAAPPTWKGALLAACWAGGFRAVASHRSAAALWSLAGGRRHIPEITWPRRLRARHHDLVVHESKAFDSSDATFVDGIPVASPELTLLGLAAVCTTSVLEMALDRAESRGLVTVPSVRDLITRLAKPGRPGIRPLRSLLDRRCPRGVSESERGTMLRQCLRSHGLPEPVMQHEMRHRGMFVGRVDAAYPDARIAIEYDSYEHHGGRLALVRDSARRTRLLAAGWHPFTATAAELRTGGRTLAASIGEVRRREQANPSHFGVASGE